MVPAGRCLRSYASPVVVCRKLDVLVQIRLLDDPIEVVDGQLRPCEPLVFAEAFEIPQPVQSQSATPFSSKRRNPAIGMNPTSGARELRRR